MLFVLREAAHAFSTQSPTYLNIIVSRAAEVRVEVVEHVCNNWHWFELYTMMPCSNNYRSVAEYNAQMSLRTTYATTCEIQAASEIYA